MQHNHYIVLKHLRENPGGVKEVDFPNEIKSEFSIRKFHAGGFTHELQIVLTSHKKWIERRSQQAGYTLTDAGLSALQVEEQSKRTHSYVTELQFEKLQKEIADIESRLQDRRPNNMRSNIAILISLIVVCIEFWRIIKGR
jgi:hypothetical protein